jgi:type VII secretion protein EccB
MGQPATRLQVSGHRFLARRMENALIRGDIRMIDDPLRAQSISLAAGGVLAAIAVVVCAVLAFVRPGGSLGDAPIVVVRESGAMYVRIDDVMHPVFNLASARLIVGNAAEPRVVSQRAIDRAERGPQVGIAGAPAQIPAPLPADVAIWTICDDEHGATRVFAGPIPDATVSPGRSALVTPRGESAAVTYLLHGGWRARVDLRHPAVVRALRVDGVVPQQVSRTVLDAIPEAPAIQPPRIPALGSPGPAALAAHPVGTVVKVPQADGRVVDYFVVLADGMQRVGEVAADLIRYTDGRAGEQIPTVSADVVGALAVVTSLPVATFPHRGGVTSARVVCARWSPAPGETASHSEVLIGDQVPAAERSITLAQTDGDGPAIDTVAVPTGRSVFARSVGLTGAGPSAGSLFLVADTGVMYGVWDDETAAVLGLADPVPAPWPVLAHLPRGPELSRREASVARDGLATVP